MLRKYRLEELITLAEAEGDEEAADMYREELEKIQG